MKELEIYKQYKIEDFLKKFNLSNGSNFDDMVNGIRFDKLNVMKIDINNDRIVEIKRGIFKGHKAKVLSDYDMKLEVRLLDDKYNNTVVIDLIDISESCGQAKITYILE